MSAKPEPKLDEIAERAWDGESVGAIRSALTEAYDLGRAERDKEWREAADHSFDGIRPNAELIEMYTSERDLPTAIIHEIWKRDPRTQEAVADERKALREVVRVGLGTAATGWGARLLDALDARESAPAGPSSDPVGGICTRCGAATGSVMPDYRGPCECEVVAAESSE
jgi:hypothetical protein